MIWQVSTASTTRRCTRLKTTWPSCVIQNIPFGLHAFGRVPEASHRASTVEAIVSTDRSLMPDAAEVLAEDMERRIVESVHASSGSLVRSLRAATWRLGSEASLSRNPDAYPTGKNFYGIDPDKVPKPAAWDIGVRLADQMLAGHLEANGAYPQKVSFVIWGDETMRHQGVLESQIFHLLGTRPVWDARGKVIGVRGRAQCAAWPTARGHRDRVGGRGHVLKRDEADG